MKTSIYEDLNYYLPYKEDFILANVKLEITEKKVEDTQVYEYKVLTLQVRPDEHFINYLISKLPLEGLKAVNEMLAAILHEDIKDNLFTLFYNGSVT